MYLGVYIVFILPFNIYVIYTISHIYDIFICTYVETYKKTHDFFPAVIIKKLFKTVALNEYRVVLLNFGNYVFFTILIYMHTIFLYYTYTFIQTHTHCYICTIHTMYVYIHIVHMCI